MLRSRGLATDVMVMRGLSTVTDHPDRVVMRTPSEPDFWYGNLVIFRNDRVVPAAQIAQFHADFPSSKHVTIAWDAPQMSHQPGHDALAGLGFDLDHTDVLTLTCPVRRAHPPAGVTIRSVQTEDDWEQVITCQIETGISEGYKAELHAPFVQQRFVNRRLQISEGWGRWLGAFDGDLLVGNLGIFADDRVARYQDVETRPSHRRRGICAALVTAAADWVMQVFPDAIPVIIADRDSDAGRIYRRCGFRLTETLVSACRPPSGALQKPE